MYSTTDLNKIDLWTDLCKFQYASTIPDCRISMFQSVIKLFQIYEFFDCKYQLAYQRSRSSNKGRLRPDRRDSIHSSSHPVRVQLAAQLLWWSDSTII
ncbi:hypothetical protein F2Q69_00044131 [Brassica cretica]|uniref:Uncharacterized protein n=1 Tax=Brassica cretica TaxID=69181 RepID=A0A8S9NSW2_BRACR|nr:hypothetical protein F2Q69_00044131 [Brassica cretica]